MYCKNCGSKIDDNSRFCHNCGISIEKNIDNKETKIKLDYFKEYVGSNYEKIKNQNFSVATLLFGPLYFLYRKIWFYGFLWVIISLLITFFFNILNLDYDLYLKFAMHLVIAFKFKEIYLSNCQENIDKIKLDNKDMTEKELASIIHKKGGVTIIPVFIYLFIIFMVFTYLIFYNIFDLFKTGIKSIDSSPNTVLEYKIPSEFNKSSNSNLYKYSDENNSCNIKISKISYTKSSNDFMDIINSIQLNEEIDIDDFKKVEINGTTWYQLDLDDSTYYIKLKRDKVYIVNYSIFKDNTKVCSNLQREFLKSLKFINLNNSNTL